jgi:hypothetical protein
VEAAKFSNVDSVVANLHAMVIANGLMVNVNSPRLLLLFLPRKFRKGWYHVEARKL